MKASHVRARTHGEAVGPHVPQGGEPQPWHCSGHNLRQSWIPITPKGHLMLSHIYCIRRVVARQRVIEEVALLLLPR